MSDLTQIHHQKYTAEDTLLQNLSVLADLNENARHSIVENAAGIVQQIRSESDPGLMEVFLAEYGLSTDEGIALMCLAEALLRVPDAETMDDLIEDKIAPSDWGKHLGKSASSLVNGSTWALMFTGRVLDDGGAGLAGQIRGAIKRLGEPVIRTAVRRAMKEMGRQFVLGETIKDALSRGEDNVKQGYTHSFDMLGEAAMTADDARRYERSYTDAITGIARNCSSDDMRQNPGISVKLSALHPRYEVAQEDRVLTELVPIVTKLARQAAKANMGFSIDAEEADRLVLSLKVIQAVLEDPKLAGWDGFGVVVQAYGRRAAPVLDWLNELATALDRKITVRLVKGAYWDTEIKLAQVEGLESFPVFTRKQATDISYIACARKLLNMTDRIYPQFATHNAHTVAAILHMARDLPRETYEFQRLHGMGERLHDIVLKSHKTGCRIYAPVGAHRDLLAYLVRRLLENGANSSFVNQIVDETVPPEEVVSCPFEALAQFGEISNTAIATGPTVFGLDRVNSKGFDLTDEPTLQQIEDARAKDGQFDIGPLIAGDIAPLDPNPSLNPATGETVGTVRYASKPDVETALSNARHWNVSTKERAVVLKRAADLYEQNFGTLFWLVAREAGKSLMDCVAELREAVDFIRYYADEAQTLAEGARGVFACISPWNFPLAIFTGQVSAALATGNGVLAKPAEQTPLISAYAVELLHQAGVPRECLQLLPGRGADVGAAITSDPRVSGVAFTGSTATAMIIRRAMAIGMSPGAPLIAETGGLNAMIVDSTALPEQAVRDIVASSFQSAGQRCSALRCLYVQEDVADRVLEMLSGAMDELSVGNPWMLKTDVGPVIDSAAQESIKAYINTAKAEGRVIKQVGIPDKGTFVAPTMLRVESITQMEREIFGPVLHVATFKAAEIDRVIADINATGYGLTFGLHTRIDSRVQQITEQVEVGNIYVNRNQIGAIVGSQPFGGEGLSGTGPKAGGPNYLCRFTWRPGSSLQESWSQPMTVSDLVNEVKSCASGQKVSTLDLPGPTGESNQLTAYARPPLVCLGPGNNAAMAQADAVRSLGGYAVVANGDVAPEDLTNLAGISGAIWWGDTDQGRDYALALVERQGAILPLITGMPDMAHAVHERHLCIDTTASGGNTKLLSLAS